MAPRKRCHSAGEGDSACDSAIAGDSTGDLPWIKVTKKGKKTHMEGVSLSQPIASATLPVSTISVQTASSENCENCVFCNSMCKSTDAIQCKTCQHFHHLACCGLDQELFPTALVIANFLGWSCEACRISSCETICLLRNELSQVLSTLSSIQATLGLVGSSSSSSPTLVGSNASTSTNGSTLSASSYASATSAPLQIPAPAITSASTTARTAVPTTDSATITRSSIATVVLGTIRDIDRRRKNVVITGLPESRHVADDVRAAADLLANHVRCPFTPEIVSCARLGKTASTTRPRKLLVRFSTEKDASAILNYAKSLRISSDHFIASNVFINADLSKDEAKIAYDRRVSRRNSAPGRMDGVGVNAAGSSGTVLVNPSDLRASAVVFQPISSRAIPVIGVNSSSSIVSS